MPAEVEALGAQAKILVVEDEASIGDLIREMLEAAGYSVQTCANGAEALRTFFRWRPDAVILDIILPRMDGWTVLGRLREISDVPVIMATALSQEHQMVRGLRQGADDYLVKPFREGELLARVDAVLRRAVPRPTEGDAYHDAVLTMDFQRHRVAIRGRPVSLTPLEFRLLAALVRNPDAVLSAGRLLEICWGDRGDDPSRVRVYIRYLRTKIENDPAHPRLIETIREFGYRYHPP